MWQRDGRMVCDTCTNNIDWGEVPRVIVIRRARDMGWHVYEGPSIDGTKTLMSHICPLCMGTARSKLPPAPPPLVEDQPLFEVEKTDESAGKSRKRHRRPRGTGD